MIEIAKLTKDNRITIPKSVREEMNWKPGQVIELVPKGSGFSLVPVPNPAKTTKRSDSSDTRSNRSR